MMTCLNYRLKRQEPTASPRKMRVLPRRLNVTVEDWNTMYLLPWNAKFSTRWALWKGFRWKSDVSERMAINTERQWAYCIDECKAPANETYIAQEVIDLLCHEPLPDKTHLQVANQYRSTLNIPKMVWSDLVPCQQLTHINTTQCQYS